MNYDDDEETEDSDTPLEPGGSEPTDTSQQPGESPGGGGG